MENTFFNPDMRNAKDVVIRKGVKCVSPKIKHCTFPDKIIDTHVASYCSLDFFFFFLKNTVKSIKNKNVNI